MARPPPLWGYGFRAHWQIGKTDLPAPRNDVESNLLQRACSSGRSGITRRRPPSGGLRLYKSAASSRLVRLTHPTQPDDVPALKFPFNRIKISLCASNAHLLLRGGRP